MSADVASGLRGLAPSEEAAERAAARAQERAAAEGAAVLAYARMDSRLGPLLVVAGARGLVRLAYAGGADADAELDRLAEAISPSIVHAPRALDAPRREIEEYLDGRRRAFATPVDLGRLAPFTREVLRAAAAIPYGEVRSYGELAAALGRPRAARAVGNALGANPVPVVVPCHRILRAGGGLGGYTGGTEKKRILLAVEGRAVPAS